MTKIFEIKADEKTYHLPKEHIIPDNIYMTQEQYRIILKKLNKELEEVLQAGKVFSISKFYLLVPTIVIWFISAVIIIAGIAGFANRIVLVTIGILGVIAGAIWVGIVLLVSYLTRPKRLEKAWEKARKGIEEYNKQNQQRGIELNLTHYLDPKTAGKAKGKRRKIPMLVLQEIEEEGMQTINVQLKNNHMQYNQVPNGQQQLQMYEQPAQYPHPMQQPYGPPATYDPATYGQMPPTYGPPHVYGSPPTYGPPPTQIRQEPPHIYGSPQHHVAPTLDQYGQPINQLPMYSPQIYGQEQPPHIYGQPPISTSGPPVIYGQPSINGPQPLYGQVQQQHEQNQNPEKEQE